MKRCLIADDSKIMRKMVRGMIEPLGFEILEAHDGTSALAVAKETPVEVIVVDWHMPGMDGVAWLNTLRGDKNARQPKVIVCIAPHDITQTEAIKQAGADEYAVKPFDATRMADIMRQLKLAA